MSVLGKNDMNSPMMSGQKSMGPKAHKVVTVDLVDEVTPAVRIAGACNAVLKRPDGTLLGDQFDEKHRQLFTFALPEDKEVVNVRAVAQGKATRVGAQSVGKGGKSPSSAKVADISVFIDGTANFNFAGKNRHICFGNRNYLRLPHLHSNENQGCHDRGNSH